MRATATVALTPPDHAGASTFLRTTATTGSLGSLAPGRHASTPAWQLRRNGRLNTAPPLRPRLSRANFPKTAARCCRASSPRWAAPNAASQATARSTCCSVGAQLGQPAAAGPGSAYRAEDAAGLRTRASQFLRDHAPAATLRGCVAQHVQCGGVGHRALQRRHCRQVGVLCSATGACHHQRARSRPTERPATLCGLPRHSFLR